jgi:hypothetical protein
MRDFHTQLIDHPIDVIVEGFPSRTTLKLVIFSDINGGQSQSYKIVLEEVYDACMKTGRITREQFLQLLEDELYYLPNLFPFSQENAKYWFELGRTHLNEVRPESSELDLPRD